MTIRPASLDDALALSQFGRRVFHSTFRDGNDPDDLDAYLDGAYTEERQRAEIEDANMSTLVVDLDGALAAFAQVRLHPPPSCVTGPAPIELWRFYVDPAWHGRGLAGGLMRAAEDTARGRGGETLWLGVWEKNERAQAFYRKQGFVEVGSQVFVVGTDPQRDLVMVKRLRGLE